MTPMFGLQIWLSENAVLPVMLQDASGNALTGYVASSLTATQSLNGAALTTLTVSSWAELGNGLYAAHVAAAQLATEGTLVYRVATNPKGTNPAFNGCAQIGHRLDQYDVRGNPTYDEVTQDFTCMVALHKNSAVVTNPLSCEIWLVDTAGNTPVHATSISPNADGVFIITLTEIALSLNMNYELKLAVTDADGTVHTSVEFGLTFN